MRNKEDFPLDLSSIKDFLSTGSTLQSPNEVQLHVLRGWGWSTLKSYNVGIRKFLQFMRTVVNPWNLPANKDDIYNFCCWAGRQHAITKPQEILLKTLKHYLYGLKAWHRYHDIAYPEVDERRVELLLLASKKEDCLQLLEQKRKAVELHHMVPLAMQLTGGSDLNMAIFDVVCVAFWGMARLSELTYTLKEGVLDYRSSVLARDVIFNSNRMAAAVVLRGTKMCQPALKRRLEKVTNMEDSLFGTYIGGKRRNLVKSDVVTACSRIWKMAGFEGISGHSFRIGGTSLRVALGISRADICFLGRWTSDSYALYV
ncbi:hypothetical protein CROQUDRAFT_133706 [Cronartium quercuum f. sp. fusiforme G11]|uniref:Tyr recombinase domain-containing protein n=1 Tax=Cronartium quercuum f. sp. fusiforme G11 TaxID=708437 RepID=A0A9P6NH59_9BASI|nr:hypothetical protein CROQUDRAFT_133706 [Cronartium quercuum f. sp. fusiforme G11]